MCCFAMEIACCFGLVYYVTFNFVMHNHSKIIILSWHFPPMRDFELQWSRALKLYCKELLIGLDCKHIEVLDAWI